MECDHDKVEYYFRTYSVGTDVRWHWAKFCTVCGQRLSNPWCPKPAPHIQATAKELPHNG